MSLKNTQSEAKDADPFLHPKAIIESGVAVGAYSSVWDHVHIRKNASIGHHTSVGEKTYIAYDVKIGNYVKINAMVYICAGVEIEDQCMVSAGVIFTNDRFPRAMNRDLTDLETSKPTENTMGTIVRKGATIGANATIGPGLEIGSYAMVGMGSVVTRRVPAYGLVLGNPAKLTGFVCICGPGLVDLNAAPSEGKAITCSKCQRKYIWQQDQLMIQ